MVSREFSVIAVIFWVVNRVIWVARVFWLASNWLLGCFRICYGCYSVLGGSHNSLVVG